MIYFASDNKSDAFRKKLIELFDLDADSFTDLQSGDPLDLSIVMAEKIRQNPQENRGIFVEQYGALPFMAASKFPSVICAEVSDEHSSKMTRDHNNANMISLGTRIIGEDVALSICRRFLSGKYSAGRHQIRIDMLDAMTKESSEDRL